MAAKKKPAKKKAPHREPPPKETAPAPVVSWHFNLLGTVLVTSGAATLLYPCFLTRRELADIGGAATYGPIAAVALMAAGVALFVIALNRRGMTEAPFALDLEERSFGERVTELLTLRFFYNTWKEIDAESDRERAARALKGGYDWRPMVALLLGAAFLAFMEYFGHADTLGGIIDHYDPNPPMIGGALREGFWPMIRSSPFRELDNFVWWSLWRVLGFFLMPAFVIKVILRENIAEYGLQTAGFVRHAWIYAFFFSIVVCLVGLVSFLPEFSEYYPFYSNASRSWYDFWAWEALYAAQFFSLEFFFRGFWLKACKRMMGSHAIYAMVVPYCMIHFGKPFLETLGAILAGVALGTLALRTRSIWSGFLIHVSVAISMDLASLMQTTGLPDRWWPPL